MLRRLFGQTWQIITVVSLLLCCSANAEEFSTHDLKLLRDSVSIPLKEKNKKVSEEQLFWQECHSLYEKGRLHLAQQREEIRNKAIQEDPTLAEPYHEADLFDLVESTLHEKIGKDQLTKSFPEGRFEINSVYSDDGHDTLVFIRVIHQKTDKSIYYTDAEHYIEETKHFQRWLDLQHVAAQRDVLGVTVDREGNPVGDVREFLRPQSMFSSLYWAKYWNAVAKGTHRSDLKIGAVCNTAELALMLCLVDLPSAGGDLAALPVTSYGVKLFFGVSIGMVALRTMQNWVELKARLDSPLTKKIKGVMKRTSVSLAFGIAMMAATQGWQSLGDLTSWTYMILNMLISNVIKDEMLNWVDVRSRLRLNSGSLEFKNPLTGSQIKLEKGQKIFEAQTLRILTGVVRYADLTLTGTVGAAALVLHQQMPGVPSWLLFGGSFVASRVAYLSLAAVPMWFNARYFKKVLRRAQKTYEADPSDTNLEEVRKIEREVEALQARTTSTFNYVKSLPTKIMLAPVKFYQGLAAWIKGPAKLSGSGDSGTFQKAGCEGTFQ